MKRIGLLTSGGDCQALNAAMRGVAKALYSKIDDVVIYGFENGYKGLVNGEYRKLKPKDFSGILTVGGTILGTSRLPFKTLSEPGGKETVEKMKKTYSELKLDCLIVLGGNGTHKTANLLSKEGLNVISLPKTIDNDIWGTDMTFGFQSAVDIVTNVFDCIHTTAASHGRVFIVEVMGHKVGWLTLHSGLAGGADIILIPEIPFSTDKLIKTINKREEEGKSFTILAVAEGAKAKKSDKSFEEYCKKNPSNYETVTYSLASFLQEKTKKEVRVTVPGHMQRGGIPCSYDRVLSTSLGATAAELIINKQYGNMVGLVNGRPFPVPLSEVAGKLKEVDPESALVRSSKAMGISFGD